MPTKRLAGEAWVDHRTDIPQWAKDGVAQIIIEWSVLERELEELIRLLMDTDIQHVRILTARMNARTRILAATHLSKRISMRTGLKEASSLNLLSWAKQ
jgi:hypothetical protein